MQRHLRESVRSFTSILNPFDREDLLERLLAEVLVTLDAQGAGILLDDGRGHLDYAAGSGERVGQIEMLQAKDRVGASHEAFKTGRLVAAADLEIETRWPDYRAQAVPLGFRSVIGAPLHAWGQTIGVLSIYRESAGAWTADEVGASEMLAALGAGYILSATQLTAQHNLAENLQMALDSRAVIEQAKGILMVGQSMNAATAFKTLRQASMDTHQKLRSVAQQIVDETEADTNQ